MPASVQRIARLLPAISSRHLDLAAMLVWPLVASALTFAFELTFVQAMILFLGIPNLFLAVRMEGPLSRSLSFSFVMGVPLAIIIDYLMEVTEAWVLSESPFGDLRLFDYVFIEQLPWLFAFALLTVLFYRHFVGQTPAGEVKRLPYRWFVGWHALLLVGFVALWALAPETLVVNFAYLKVGIVLGVLPLVWVLFTAPSLLKRFVVPTLFFIWFSGIYEAISLSVGHWAFPNTDQFVGWVTLLGHPLPFEEILFWIILGPASCLSYFEIFGGEPGAEPSEGR